MEQGDSSIGQVIDGFRILEVLGKGGMGVVYKAEDLALSRTVAIKMIAPELSSNETFLRRFHSEARALARVESPFIVGVHALRQVEDSFFIVMEYVDGWTLADEIEKGVIEFSRARSVLSQMLQAFAKAHSVGVIHRDIKPRNIMITGAGRVKVTDFGLAKLRRGDDGHSTVTQGMAGTARYMSPEQVLGTTIDHRSDLYSLGMTMYEMLAGVLPFGLDEGTFTILKRIVEEDLPSPLEYNPNIPRQLVDIIQKAIEKNPEKRFQSAKEMHDALNKAFNEQKADHTVASPKPSRIDVEPAYKGPAPTAARAGSKSKRIWIAAAVVAVLLLAYPLSRLFSGDATPPSLAEQETDPNGVPAENMGAMQFAELRVSSIPAGATVVVDREPKGIASENGLRLEVPEGSINLALQLDGYEPLDTMITVSSDMLNRVELPLERIAMAQNNTPQDPQSKGGPANTTEGSATDNGRREVAPAEIAPTRAVGSIRFAVEPAGAIYVDGQRYQNDTPALSLPVGTHDVRFVDAKTGTEKETAVLVEPGDNQPRTLYFEHLLDIQVKWEESNAVPWTSISINGEDIEWTAPLDNYELYPGEYEVALSRSGYELSPPQRLVIEPTFDKSQTEHKLFFEIKKAQN